MVGFTPYVEQADPELVRGLQTAFFATARRVVGQYGGVVERYIGDAVMALFGAPVATETDVLRCVHAGLELQRALTRLSLPGPARPQFRVGIATGEALVDITAAREGGQAIVAGDVAPTASRIQNLAPPDGVLVCGTTYAATRTAVRYTEQQPALLRGRSVPTELWLAQASLGSTHPDREQSRTPLVNRNHELALLINALHRAFQERTPQLVTVLGHAGIGKSRLVLELVRHTDRLYSTPVTWRTGRCPPFGENLTYAALADIVKGQAGILDTDDAEVARGRLEATLRTLIDPDDVGPLANALSPLVGLAGTKLPADDAESAWRRFVVALAGNGPTVLVLEDLHWADESMLRFIERLGASVREVPLLLLCTARPELVAREPTWAGTIGGSVTITLPPLRDTEIATMYAHLLGHVAFPADSIEPLIELADGNPLYAHEYTRMLIEQGQAPERVLAQVDSSTPMPDSVHAVIANRIDLLDPTDRAVLQTASVVGVQFWPGAIGAALGLSVQTVDRALRRLEQRDLIHEELASTMADQAEFRFGHVLMRDVCYQRLPRTERIALHQRTADWLDRLRTDRETDLAEVLAYHRYTAHEIARTLGLDPDQYVGAAREALYQAALRAYALHALDTAAVHLGRALALRETQEHPAHRLRLDLLATEIAFYTDREAFLGAGGPQRLVSLAERLDEHGEPGGAARAWTLLGQTAWLRADRTEALACLGRAVARYEPLSDSGAKAEAYAELGRLHMLNYEHEPAIAAATTAVAIADRLGLIEVKASAEVTIGTTRYNAGDRGGLAELHRVFEFCQGHRLLACRRATQNLSFALREEGDWPGSQRLLTEHVAEVPGGHNLITDYSEEAMIAYFGGDWTRLVEAVDAYLANRPFTEWDVQVQGLRVWIGVLREEDVEPGMTNLLAIAERSGFHRIRWGALAHAALCHAVRQRSDQAHELLTELARQWRAGSAILSGEWLPAAAHAAALAGPASATVIAELISTTPHRTIWVDAAERTITGALAAADKDDERAARQHLAAAELYQGIPTVTDRIIALAAAARALPDDAVTAVRAELRAFADQHAAPGLLALADLA